MESFCLSMDSRGESQTFNIRSQTRCEIVPESEFLDFIKQKSFIQILEGILGNEDFCHPRPIANFTLSHSSSLAFPDATFSRRFRNSAINSGGTGVVSQQSRISSQRTSMICSFSFEGSALISCVVMAKIYRGDRRMRLFFVRGV